MFRFIGSFYSLKEYWNMSDNLKKKKETPWPLVRKQTTPTEQPPLVG
jgi:hypothetical protein